MPYRNPNQPRIQAQAQTVFQYAGQQTVWREYVSAATGLATRGQGTTLYYREQSITALFAPLPVNDETQTPAGMIAATRFQVSTRQQLARQDELRWRGEIYRVESDPSPATLPGWWVATVARGYTGA